MDLTRDNPRPTNLTDEAPPSPSALYYLYYVQHCPEPFSVADETFWMSSETSDTERSKKQDKKLCQTF